MNAKEVSGKRFEKSAFGYKPEEVDEYLREIAMEMSDLQKEKEDCNKKIDVLADKVREYMKDEDALKEALMGAQRQARMVVEEAKATASQILTEANRKADQIIGQTHVQLENEKQNLLAVQKEVSDFKARLLTVYKEHLDLITAMPDMEEDELEEEVYQPEEEMDEEPSSAASAGGYGGEMNYGRGTGN